VSGGRAGTAARAGAVFALTLAVLQVLQQVVGAFNPRPSVSALIALTAATATFALDRLRQGRQAVSERDGRLDAALTFWPLRRLREVDRRRLGVFPPRLVDGEPADAAYVPRPLDARLRDAIRPGSFVLVLGPPRAGKSRTALEAADGDAWLIVPRDAAGLRAIADVHPPPGAVLAEDTVLWLDDLERYVEALDAGVLDRILGYEPPPAVVATMRTDEYDALLAAAGERGEAARAVAARAHAIELPDDGTGSDRVTTGRDDEPAVPPLPPASSAPRDASGNLRDRLFVGSAAVALAGLVATVAVSLGGGFSEPSLAARIDAIRAAATGDRRSAEMTRTADFHGSGEPSYFFLFSDQQSLPAPGRAPRPRTSDEIRIYDRRGNGLRERFRFQPDAPGLVFRYRYLGDLDGDGEQELVGGYGVPGEASEALLPFVVDWDEGHGRYRLTSLQLSAPVPVATPSALGVPYVAAYRRRLDLRDRSRHLSLSGYRVQDFAVVAPSRLIGGVVVKPMTPTLTGTVELRPSILRIAAGAPTLIPCRLAGDPSPRILWKPGRLLASVIRERWAKLAASQPCSP
jgi:hypothetical protein